MKATVLKEEFLRGERDDLLRELYLDEHMIPMQRERYAALLEKFAGMFGDGEVQLYSAPGRSEVGGNHTDHQHGKVLAASINLDMIAAVRPRDDGKIVLQSGDYPKMELSVDELDPKPEEKGTSRGLIRGVMAGLNKLGYPSGGMEGCMTSNVLSGSGLSSSAAFEVLIGHIISGMYHDGKISPVLIAQIAQISENVYFGKPCGLMDQMACSVGGLITIDFEDVKKPSVRKISTDFAEAGLSLCIVDTKGSHAGLTDEYAAIPNEMKAVARELGGTVLREVSEEALYEHLPELRAKLGDRPVLRAIHFFEEEKRVDEEVAALAAGDFARFLQVLLASGDSSYKYLQNVSVGRMPQEQSVAIGLAVSDLVLAGRGAHRVHGGGFAGTIQAFVPDEVTGDYKKAMDHVFGEDACHVLKVRPDGGRRVI
ncbi:MAG: galactokinase [Lachnospiraceae bacterium]|nr:galactokinase [Lachnospiraceae bacterium]